MEKRSARIGNLVKASLGSSHARSCAKTSLSNWQIGPLNHISALDKSDHSSIFQKTNSGCPFCGVKNTCNPGVTRDVNGGGALYGLPEAQRI
jgi:hypothetical protein